MTDSPKTYQGNLRGPAKPQRGGGKQAGLLSVLGRASSRIGGPSHERRRAVIRFPIWLLAG